MGIMQILMLLSGMAATAFQIRALQERGRVLRGVKRYTTRATGALTAEREAEGRRAKRRAIARAQVMGAAGGATVGPEFSGQITRDVDAQTALDVWGIRAAGWRNVFSLEQEIEAAKQEAFNVAFQNSMSGFGLLGSLSQGGGGGGGTSMGSSLIGSGTGASSLGAGSVTGDFGAGFGAAAAGYA